MYHCGQCRNCKRNKEEYWMRQYDGYDDSANAVDEDKSDNSSNNFDNFDDFYQTYLKNICLVSYKSASKNIPLEEIDQMILNAEICWQSNDNIRNLLVSELSLIHI